MSVTVSLTENAVTVVPAVNTVTVANDAGVAPYSLPTATDSVLGGVKVGTGLSITDGVLSATASGASADFGPFEFYADMLENPTSANWAVNSLAPVDVDDDNSGLLVRAFDDTTAEGVGFSVKVPSTATKMRLSFVSRGKTAPGTAAKVGLNLYSRGIPDNAAVEAWSAAFALADIDIPTNEYYQYDTQLLTIGDGEGELDIAVGVEYQFQLNRNPSVASDLTGDWFLRVLRILFE